MKGLMLAMIVALLWSVAPINVRAEEQGPLARYVAKADDSFHWTKRREGSRGDASWVELTLTSQTWQGIEWKHQLYLLKPSKVRDSSRALLYISGGAWKPEFEQPPKDGEQIPSQAGMLLDAAEHLGTPVAIILQVPQQPLFDGMTEDRLISYTFEKFLRTGDDTWPLLLPMTKSAVRAMDTLQAYA
ncbi:MAG TPA: PhoPQ-activated protein PqaA family protein, partial [Pirellulales bacterium]|nr:PhoPQ-activated protein PqaA family protein [Pirellulales bacterium]